MSNAASPFPASARRRKIEYNERGQMIAIDDKGMLAPRDVLVLGEMEIGQVTYVSDKNGKASFIPISVVERLKYHGQYE